MLPIGNHGLACLDGEDYAAIALYMQDQAVKIDDALDSISDQFDTFYGRPAALWTSTVSTTMSAVYPVYSSFTINSIVYSNFTVPAFTLVTIPRTGWYQYGSNANMTPTGAVTAGSVRRLRVTAQLQTIGPDTTLSSTEDESFETNTGGGEWLVVSGGTFYAKAGASVSLNAEVAHGNAASSLRVEIGARVWLYYIGSGVEIGSA